MTHPKESPSELLTYQQAADVLGTSPAFIERLVAQRRIAYVKLGHFVRIRRGDLDAFIQSSRVAASREVK